MSPVESSVPTRGIARRLILAMVLFSSLITLIVTAIQLYRDYNRDLLLIDSQLKQIEDVHLRSIAGNLWLLDEKGMQTLVDGILQLPDLLYLEISDGERIWATGGKNQNENVIVRRYPLVYQQLEQKQEIGVMTAVVTLERVYQRLIDKAVDILISNAIKTFLVAGFMLLLFYFLVTRHLIEIAGFVRNQELDKESPPLSLDRRSAKNQHPDELDLVVDEINEMHQSLQQTYATLKESENKYRELYDNMAQGVIYRDQAGKIVSANKAAHEILGLTMGQMQGMVEVNPVWRAIQENGEVLPDDAFPSMQAMRTGESIDNVVIGLFHPIEQQYRWILVSSEPGVKAGGETASLAFSTFTDITERKLADQEREQLIKELEIKNAELERFAYTISHELKSPLVTIAGFSGFLLKDVETKDREKLAADVQQVTAAVDTMSVLLDELLELSRIGRVNYPSEEVAFDELVQEVKNSIPANVIQGDVSIEIDSDLPVVNGDKVRLREVMQNLIENAIKFQDGQSRPYVKIGLRMQADEEVIFVEDNGKGIDPAYQDRIFDLFERLDHSIEGTGIGLALVHRIVEQHGGRVWVESEGVGTGSTFCFTIPKQSS